MKKIVKRKTKQKKATKALRAQRFTSSGRSGLIILLLIGIVVVGSMMLSGLIGQKHRDTSPLSVPTSMMCCDTGDGDACKPQTGPNQTITYNGAEYGLIRSSVEFVEGNLHLKDTGEQVNGNPVVVNSTDKHATCNTDANIACTRPNPITEPRDLFFKKNPQDPYMFMKTAQPEPVIAEYCTSIPNDEIIFVCKSKDNCHPNACSYPGAETEQIQCTTDNPISCYGTDKSIYDVYFRLSDTTTPGVPPFIKNCDKTGLSSALPTGQPDMKIVTPTGYGPSGKKNLQLRTFGLVAGVGTNPWLSPLCKPAIYLYPTEKTNVTVKINPQGPLTLTIPIYPESGWNVTAFPNGTIISGSQTLDYLYYEAKIPDNLLSTPDTGYVVTTSKMKAFLSNLLPKLGLNEKESAQFVDYWTKALKNSPYHEVSIVSPNTLNTIAPLTISPTPQTTIRVTLLFKPLDNPVSIKQPTLTPVSRNGFTVVEWGGLYKQDKNHPFTCLM